MTLKDWKRFTTQDKGNYILYKKGKEYVEIFKRVNEWVVAIFTDTERISTDEFNSKPQALSYAKQYMMTH